MDQVNSDSCKSQCNRITGLIDSSQNAIRDYKKEIEMLRQEVALMENHLSTQNDENVKVLNPYIMGNF